MQKRQNWHRPEKWGTTEDWNNRYAEDVDKNVNLKKAAAKKVADMNKILTRPTFKGTARVGDRFKHANQQWTIKNALIREIEEATKDQPTPEKYIKDPLVAYQLAKVHLQRSIDELAYTKAKKAEMIERGWAGDEKLGKSKGWKTTEFPGLQGLYVEPRLAAALDRWGAIKPGDPLTDQLIAANQFLLELCLVSLYHTF